MATPYNPSYQPYPPQGQAAYPPQVAYGYPPQDQGASAQYPPPPKAQGYPLQGYPPQPQTDLAPAIDAPAYQGPPPDYVYKPDQPAYNNQPQLASTTVVVAAQPVTATTTSVSPPEENHSGIAICALVFSLCTLFTSVAFLICLSLSIPALVLAIVALSSRGNSQKSNAGISIGLNVAVVVCTVVLLVAVVTPVAVTAGTRYCPSYYSSSYRTYCVPYSYSAQGSCSYYDSGYSGYCPSTTSYRCPNFYSTTYGTYCTAFGYYTCYYSSSSCPTSLSRYCLSFYSSSYSTRCVADTSATRSSTPCTYSVSYFNSGYCPT